MFVCANYIRVRRTRLLVPLLLYTVYVRMQKPCKWHVYYFILVIIVFEQTFFHLQFYCHTRYKIHMCGWYVHFACRASGQPASQYTIYKCWVLPVLHTPAFIHNWWWCFAVLRSVSWTGNLFFWFMRKKSTASRCVRGGIWWGAFFMFAFFLFF